jgi:hypothetical protein
MTEENNFSIIWQKWSDPFGLDDNIEIQNDTFEEFGNFIEESELEDLTESGDLTPLKIEDYLDSKKFKGKIKVIATPMGMIPLNDNTASNKIFNFWVGHTNFDITHHIGRIIELTDGVETLDIFTRYRFRIAVGKAFDDSIVMRQINSRVYSELMHVEH